MPVTNKLILGTVQFGLNYGISNIVGKLDQIAINEILETAYFLGIRILDTAEAYGNAHDVIGNFHDGHPDKIFKIITKLPHHLDDHIENKISNYLAQLKVNSLEALMFHSFKTYQENKTDGEFLLKLKKKYKINLIGVSIYTNDEMAEVIEDDNIDLIQLPFNLFDNLNLRNEILKLAKKRGKIVHSRSAFLQGLFFKSPEDQHKVVQDVKSELLKLNQISLHNNISISDLALSYVLNQPNIDQVLIGVDSKEHLLENFKSTAIHLDQKIIEEINKIQINKADLLNPSLWKQ